jgi:hypothetical protein
MDMAIGFPLRSSGSNIRLSASEVHPRTWAYDRNPEIAPPTALDDDYFLGARLTLNDAQDTSALVGTIIDRNLGSSIVFIEAERRIGNSWRFEIEGRMFFNIDKDDPLFGFANDGFFTLRLSRFF